MEIPGQISAEIDNQKRPEKPEPVESLVKALESLLARAKLGELRAIGLTGVELVKNPEDYVCKYSISVSYECDTDDPYTPKRRLLDNCIMPDLESVDFPSPNPEPET
jgi:hypothetical protein